MRQDNTGDKGPVIIYHCKSGEGEVEGFGDEHGQTSPIPPLNLIL